MSAVEFARLRLLMSEHQSDDEPTVAELPTNTPHQAPEDEFAVAFSPGRARRRRVRYETRTDADGWWRIDEEWTGCTWRTVGREPVVDVVVKRVDDA